MQSADRLCDVLVVGGGVGGVAAAMAAARRGVSVVLTEESPWLGGQLTSQGVPPDENPWIEQFGSTASYRAFRESVRAYYRRAYPLSTEASAARYLNPGNASVSKLSFEPLVGLAVLNEMAQPFRSNGTLDIRTSASPVSAVVDGDRIESVSCVRDDGRQFTIEAGMVIDATEMGDLLPLVGAEYVIGFEARSDTQEPEAPDVAAPMNQQALTVVFAMDHIEGADFTIDRPDEYDFWKSYQADHWPGPHLGWHAPNPRTLVPRTYELRPNDPRSAGPVLADESKVEAHLDMWVYRRIRARSNFVQGMFDSDVCLVNWPMNDYWTKPIVDVPAEVAEANLASARQLSLSLLYWLQTEAPRPDGGTGFPGLRLRGDLLGDTADGLAMRPYIRESRRILAKSRVTSVDIAKDASPEPVARFPDSVGVGAYRLDLHPSTGGDPYIDLACRPFEIPMGMLIPRRIENLLAGAKNVGSTHVSNGSFRLHPVEWNIGEAAGALAVFSARRRTVPAAVHGDTALVAEFQSELENDGFELHWPLVEGY